MVSNTTNQKDDDDDTDPWSCYDMLLNATQILALLMAQVALGLYFYLHFTGQCKKFTTYSEMAILAAAFCVLFNLIMIIFKNMCNRNCACLKIISCITLVTGLILVVCGILDSTGQSGLQRFAGIFASASGVFLLMESVMLKVVYCFCCFVSIYPFLFSFW